MSETLDRQEIGAATAAADATRASHPLAHLFATVERSVEEIRGSDVSGYDVRMQARERQRGQAQVWAGISGKRRGAR